MGFVAQWVAGGQEQASEYAIMDPFEQRWLTVTHAGAVRFASATPIRLATLWPLANAAAPHDPADLFEDAFAGAVGSYEFAANVLTWLRETAQTGSLRGLRYADCPQAQAARAGIVQCLITRPVWGQTGLAFDRLRGRDVVFEVRGPIQHVEAWVAQYLRDYPTEAYKTARHNPRDQDGQRTLRVTRERLFD